MNETILRTSDIRVRFSWRRSPSFILERMMLELPQKPSGGPEISGDPPPERLVSVFRAVRRYLASEIRELPLDYLDLSGLTRFQRCVLSTLREKVPYGSVIAYGELAKLAGVPKAARAVGAVLRSNPFPLFLPCHRVVRSDGSIGGFQGGSASGERLKRWLLKLESDPS